MRLWIWMWKNGRMYVRSLFGFETRRDAMVESHMYWKEGFAVLEEELHGKWYVWRSL